ncbi:MAG TPA: ABC transporter substrate-binding protein [Sandaracinaceae bacterium LLY-WYZ-13_1]|nr:ABC transporter substrate-binding protein [Sandaracinaceae bacterium LLY-WYZ-13_1]
MSRTSLVNGAAFLAAVGLSVAASGAPPPAATEPTYAVGARASVSRSLTDATGVEVPLRAYARIASASTVADRLVAALCAPERILAVTDAADRGPDGARFEGRARIASIDDVETLAGLRPDLVLVHNVADARRVERLREAGLTVFDLGRLEGMRTLPEDARQVAALCGDADRGARYAARLTRRMEAISDVPRAGRRRAIYLTLYGDRLFGGTVGTSYHDVLTAAGLRDAAAQAHRGWPQYALEEVVALDPPLVVTREGMADRICGHPTLSRLRACEGGVVEMDGDLLDAPGPGMVEAAEALHRAVYRATDR